MKCLVCDREAVEEYCVFHAEAYQNIVQTFEGWKQATDDNGGQYYVYSVVPEFSSLIILTLTFVVAFVAVTIFRKLETQK